MVEQATLDLTQAALERDDLSPAVRRALVDAGSELAEGVRSQAAVAGLGGREACHDGAPDGNP